MIDLNTRRECQVFKGRADQGGELEHDFAWCLGFFTDPDNECTALIETLDGDIDFAHAISVRFTKPVMPTSSESKRIAIQKGK